MAGTERTEQIKVAEDFDLGSALSAQLPARYDHFRSAVFTFKIF